MSPLPPRQVCQCGLLALLSWALASVAFTGPTGWFIGGGWRWESFQYLLPRTFAINAALFAAILMAWVSLCGRRERPVEWPLMVLGSSALAALVGNIVWFNMDTMAYMLLWWGFSLNWLFAYGLCHAKRLRIA